MAKQKYNLHLKGYVGGCDFDRDYVDYILAQNSEKPVSVLIDSLGGSLATALSIASSFKAHGDVAVHFAGMNASAATIASLGASSISIDSSAMYLVHKCSSEFFQYGNLNADDIATLIKDLKATKRDLDKLDANIAEMYAGTAGGDSGGEAFLGGFDEPDGFRIGDALGLVEEALLAVECDQVDAELALEDPLHFLRLVEAHAAVVDEHADELLADRLLEEDRADRAVHAAAHREKHLLVADLLADRGDFVLDVGLGVEGLADLREAFLFCLSHSGKTPFKLPDIIPKRTASWRSGKSI